MVECCSERMPRWHPISISGYHIREAGSTAAQELAFTLKDGFDLRRVGAGARFGRRRLRAAAVASSSTRTSISSRRSRSTAPRGASGPGSCATPSGRKDRALAADALPLPDRRCLADRAAAAEQHRAHGARGPGRRSSAAPSRCTPTPSTRRSRCRPRRRSGLALRTQQIIADETGVTNTIDPLGGKLLHRGAD